MTRKTAAHGQHEPGATRTDETEDGTGRSVRSDQTKTGSNGSARPIQEHAAPELLKDGPDDQTTMARAAWLEVIRALARAAAQADHEALNGTDGRAI